MQPEQSRNPTKYDPATQKVMDAGITRYFAPVEDLSSPVDVRAKLEEAAKRLDEFLEGEGKGSDFANLFDDLDSAGLRSCALWIPPGTLLSVREFDELFGIATSGNARPSPGQSESAAFENFRLRVEGFIEIYGFGNKA